MSTQPFTDPYIFEVSAKAIDMHYSSRSITFNDDDGLHRFYFDHHPGYVPVTIFLQTHWGPRALIAWTPPSPLSESDF